MVQKNGGLKLFSGTSNPDLYEKIAKMVGVEPGLAVIQRFSDREIFVEIDENVRGMDVFVVQSTCTPANEHLMELLIMIDALRRSSAGRITAVIPYFGYARQDRKVLPRTPITAKLVADLITASGANRILSIDLHAGQIQGFFNIPVDHLYATPIFLEYLMTKKISGEDLVIVSPDAGGTERARAYAKRLNADLAIMDKRRPKANKAEVLNIIGDVTGKRALIVDDMVDTAGTLTQAAKALIDNGATEVMALCTHPVLSGEAVERIKGSSIKELIVADTIPLSAEARKMSKIKVLSVSELIGKAIMYIHSGDSVSSLFV